MTESDREKIDIRPILRKIGRKKLVLAWPSSRDVTAIGALMLEKSIDGEVSRAAVLSAVLEILGNIPCNKAAELASEFPDELEAVIQHLFKNMRASMQPLDPRLSERLPLILAGEVR
jgi:predicted HTH transcriptional regulator